MNKTKKYKKKVKKYKLKKFTKRNFRDKKFTKRNFSKKKFIKKRFTKKRFTKKRFTKKKLTQKGGSDSFTDAVNIAEDVGGGVDLFNLAGSVTKTISQKFLEKVGAKSAGETTDETAAAGSGEAETENVSQAGICKGLTKLAKLGVAGGTVYAGIAAGKGLAGALGPLLKDNEGQSQAQGKYSTQTTDTNQSQGTANDAANAGPSQAKQSYQEKQAAGVTS